MLTTLLIDIPNLRPYYICDFEKQTSRKHSLVFNDGKKHKLELKPYVQIYQNKDQLFLKFNKQVSLKWSFETPDDVRLSNLVRYFVPFSLHINSDCSVPLSLSKRSRLYYKFTINRPTDV